MGLAFGVTAVWPITVVAVAILCWALIAQFTTVQRDRQQVAAGSIDHSSMSDRVSARRCSRSSGAAGTCLSTVGRYVRRDVP